MQTVWAELPALASSEQGFESGSAKRGQLGFYVLMVLSSEVADGDTGACRQISIHVSNIWLSPGLRLVVFLYST